MHRKFLKWTAIALGTCCVVLAALLVAFQLAIARVPEKRLQLEEWLSEKTRLSIEFAHISARLRLYGPELVFKDVTVRTQDRTRVLATARGGSVAFDIWNSIGSGRLIAGRFTLDSPQLGLIRTRDGRFQVVGQSAIAEQTKPLEVENLPVGEFRVRDAVVTFQDESTERTWSLSGVHFVLVRGNELLELDGNASLPETLGRSLEFAARVTGALETPESVVSELKVHGEGIELAGWAELFPESWSMPTAGRGSIALTAALLGTQVQSIAADADFRELEISTPAWSIPLPGPRPLVIGGDMKNRDADEEGSPAQSSEMPTRADVPRKLEYERVRVRGYVGREGEGWRARVNELQLASRDPSEQIDPWQSRKIDVAWSTADEQQFRFNGEADLVVLHELTPFLAFLPENPRLAHLRALDPSGFVRNLAFSVERGGADAPLRYNVSADIEALSVDPVLKAPAIAGISGKLTANDKEGELRLDTGRVELSIPWMFRWTLDTNALRGALRWHVDGEGWHIRSDDLEFAADDGHGHARLAIRLPRDGSSPYLDISARAQDMNAASTPKYLPANLLSEEALGWLDRAFVSGRVTRGSLELHGPTRAFPFRKGEGLFLVEGHVEGLTFDYQPGWTPATGLAGKVEFRNEGMHASGVTARVGELQVTEASGGFKDFAEGDLKIAVSAQGDLGAAFGFLQSSPIGEALGESFQALRGKGALQAKVSLLLPIKHIEDRRLSVSTKLTDATVRLADLDAPVTHLNGSFIVRQDLPVEADLTGQWLGGPVEVQITPDDRTDQNSTLVARGRATALELARHAPAVVKLDGALDWTMKTRLTSRPGRKVQVFAIDSSTEGLGIDLPYPVGKAQDAARALHVELEYSGRQVLTRASFGDLRALLLWRPEQGDWMFDRGSVRADRVAASLPDHPGLRLEGSIDRLRLDDWFALADADDTVQTGTGAGGQKLSDILRAANLHVGVLQLFGYEWPDVRGVLQATPQGWRVDVTGSNVEGQILVPESFKGTQPLTLDLERLMVIRAARGSGERGRTESRDPREWPSLRVHIGDMHLESHPIGGVELYATRVPNGLRIDSLSIAQDAVQAEAQGEWLIGPQGERSQLTAKITSTDVRATLRALNYTEFLDAKRAEVSAQLSWPGGFDSSLIQRASGSISVKAESGQLLMLQPGAGRVLGLFSVAALPRRLALDFSDLTDKGLSFDTIHGDFELRAGNAYTNNLLLRGPAAEIGVAGRTGLSSQDFDQTAVVTGNLGASIPVAGAIAGGPAVGAALLLFSQMFKEPLKGIARGYYRITGTWDDPLVERVDASEAKESRVN